VRADEARLRGADLGIRVVNLRVSLGGCMQQLPRPLACGQGAVRDPVRRSIRDDPLINRLGSHRNPDTLRTSGVPRAYSPPSGSTSLPVRWRCPRLSRPLGQTREHTDYYPANTLLGAGCLSAPAPI
jgi:hypothetical protein